MKETTDRRRFIGLVGVTGMAGTAGCIGGSDLLDSSDREPDTDDDQSGKPDAETTEDETFDFPDGADEGGLSTDRVVSGARHILATTDRYRIEHEYELDYANGSPDVLSLSYDIDESTVLERRRQGESEIERLVTPDGAVCRSSEVDGERSGRWMSDIAGQYGSETGDLHILPFGQTGVASLVEGTSFSFEEVITEDDRSYARYEGTILQPGQISLQRWNSARVTHQLESSSSGTVSLLLAENGALREVRYEIDGDVTRLLNNDHETLDTTISGEVRFVYDDLETVTTPEWAETDGSEAFREFSVEERSMGHLYEMTRGPKLPGSVETEYADFFVTAHFDGEQHTDRFSGPLDFEVGDKLFAGFDGGEFVTSRRSISGRNAFADADRVAVSIYLYRPGAPRALIYHEALVP